MTSLGAVLLLLGCYKKRMRIIKDLWGEIPKWCPLETVRDDNRIENLALVSRHNHPHNTVISNLQKRIRALEDADGS